MRGDLGRRRFRLRNFGGCPGRAPQGEGKRGGKRRKNKPFPWVWFKETVIIPVRGGRRQKQKKT